MKKIIVMLSPLLIFAILFIPYSWANSEYIVEWLGCGCPTVDEFGNVIENNFNANTFTAIFWSFVALCSTAISVRISKEMGWLKVLYVPFMFAASCFIAYQFYIIMLWK